MLARLLTLLLLLGFAAATQAQLRTLPQDAKRGRIQHVQDMDVAIDGHRRRLAVGAQIRDASNRIVVPAAIPAGAQASYTVNPDGHVGRVWLLTPQEAASQGR